MIDFKEILGNVRQNVPLVHNITNYVTVNDCANILLACGGSPIMSDDTDDVVDITSICGGLNINIGTLNKNTIPSMFLAGKRANELGHPVLLDPVGAGASRIRTETAAKLLEEIRFAVIRGNISEIKALAQGSASTKGVDADENDQVNTGNLDGVIAFAKAFSVKTGAVVAITGALDVITDGEQVCLIHNGHPMMSRITGTGCMLSAMTTAFVTANPGKPFEAVCAAVIAMGLSGEIAHKRLTELDGNASYRNYIIDAVYNLTAEQLEDGAKYEMR
ncbi:MAG: hydroxyethylthiazole kinase [Lachnospiraceae bacterium]|nr:hydroxyethylthiazole kinase [Lachnospiraceae bacterium]